jgi:hypothetical protein
MASYIYFSAGGENLLSVKVQEEPPEVHAAVMAAGADQPCRLTGSPKADPIYVNPHAIAYWKHARSATARSSPTD